MIADPISGIIAKAKGSKTKTYYLTMIHDLDRDESVIADCTQQIISREDFEWLVRTGSKFYANHSDYEIAGMNLEIRESVTTFSYKPIERDMPAQKDEGFVYLLKADNGFYKIGRTISLDDRIKQLGTASPCELELVLSIESDDCRNLEESLHELFDDRRVKGEWFELDSKDIAYIRYIFCARDRPNCIVRIGGAINA